MVKTEHVKSVWEFYRDTTGDVNEPMRRRFHELDSYVAHLESLTDDGERVEEERDRLRLEVEGLEEERENHIVRIDEIEEENAKLRELCIDFASMLTYADLDGLRVEATIGGVTKTYDASELCDKVEEI